MRTHGRRVRSRDGAQSRLRRSCGQELTRLRIYATRTVMVRYAVCETASQRRRAHRVTLRHRAGVQTLYFPSRVGRVLCFGNSRLGRFAAAACPGSRAGPSTCSGTPFPRLRSDYAEFMTIWFPRSPRYLYPAHLCRFLRCGRLRPCLSFPGERGLRSFAAMRLRLASRHICQGGFACPALRPAALSRGVRTPPAYPSPSPLRS